MFRGLYLQSIIVIMSVVSIAVMDVVEASTHAAQGVTPTMSIARFILCFVCLVILFRLCVFARRHDEAYSLVFGRHRRR